MMDRQRRNHGVVRLRGCGRGGEICGHEAHASARRLQALARDRQHLGGEIEQGKLRLGKRFRNHRGQQAGAGAQIEHLETGIGRERQQL